MALCVLIAVDFRGATDDARSSFYAFMDSNDFVPVPDIPGTWAGQYPEADAAAPDAREAICDHAATMVRKGMSEAGLRGLNAVVHVGWDVPTLLDWSC